MAHSSSLHQKAQTKYFTQSFSRIQDQRILTCCLLFALLRRTHPVIRSASAISNSVPSWQMTSEITAHNPFVRSLMWSATIVPSPDIRFLLIVLRHGAVTGRHIQPNFHAREQTCSGSDSQPATTMPSVYISPPTKQKGSITTTTAIWTNSSSTINFKKSKSVWLLLVCIWIVATFRPYTATLSNRIQFPLFFVGSKSGAHWWGGGVNVVANVDAMRHARMSPCHIRFNSIRFAIQIITKMLLFCCSLILFSFALFAWVGGRSSTVITCCSFPKGFFYILYLHW